VKVGEGDSAARALGAGRHARVARRLAGKCGSASSRPAKSGFLRERSHTFGIRAQEDSPDPPTRQITTAACSSAMKR
jgi:hypothetical protein